MTIYVFDIRRIKNKVQLLHTLIHTDSSYEKICYALSGNII